MFQFMIDKYIKKEREKVYAYTLSQVLDDLIELYSNTWDKDRVRHIMCLVIGINIDAYFKDTELRKKTREILQLGEKND